MRQLEDTTLKSLLVRREPLLVAGVVFLAHVALRAAGRILIGAFNDDGAYVALGQALAGGVGYRLIYLVGDPVAVEEPPPPPPPDALPLEAVRSPPGGGADPGVVESPAHRPAGRGLLGGRRPQARRAP